MHIFEIELLLTSLCVYFFMFRTTLVKILTPPLQGTIVNSVKIAQTPFQQSNISEQYNQKDTQIL